VRLEDLKEEVLRDPEARRQYAAEDLVHRVAVNTLRLRTERGWTQAELAERAQTDQARIARIEGGEVNLTLRRLAALAYALEVEASELVGEVPVPVYA
jgi:transcriptional regulator with XRE-family HTH domain